MEEILRKISFVIPCYRSENTLSDVVEDIVQLMNEHKEDDFEVLLVNDNSPDNTFKVIEKLSAKYAFVVGVDLAKNMGQHAAVMAGLRLSGGDCVVCLDDDGQTPPLEAYKLIDALEKYDVVYANYQNKQHSGARNIGSKLNGKMLEVMLDKPRDLYVSSYFAAHRFIVDKMCEYTSAYPYIMGLVLRCTNNIGSVEVDHKKREVGTTGYTLKKLFSLWINGFTAFSVKPLRVATFAGLVLTLIGLLFGCWAVYNKISNPLAPLGWTTIVMLLLLIGGTILAVLGMLGEYIGRIYMCINESPQYVIRRIVRKHSD